MIQPKTEEGAAVTDGGAAITNGPTNVPAQADTLTGTTQEALTTDKGVAAPKTRTPRQPRQRGPPEDGVPSKTKIMVANLPYDLREEKVRRSPRLLES